MTYLLTKLARALFTGWLAVTFVFVMLRISGDPALEILGGELPPETLDRFREGLGLDRPLWAQYLGYWAELARGEFGQSFRDGRDAWAVVMEAVPKTAVLLGAGFLVALAIGLPAGILAALRHNSAFDRLVIVVAGFGVSVPNFFLAIVLILVFALHLQLLPAGGSADWTHLVLPAIALGSYYAAMLARFARTSTLDVLGRPFLAASRARGFGSFTTLRRHTLPNAVLPTVTITGLMVGGLMVGAVSDRNLPVVQLIVLLLALVMVVTNLLVDLLSGWFDARLRRHGAEAAR